MNACARVTLRASAVQCAGSRFLPPRRQSRSRRLLTNLPPAWPPEAMHKISEVGGWAIASSSVGSDKVRIVNAQWDVDVLVPKSSLHDLVEAIRQATEKEPG